MFKASNIHYESAERGRGVNCGGIGAIHLMVKRLGLVEELDEMETSRDALMKSRSKH